MKLTVKKESLLLDYLYENIDMPKKRIKQYLTHGAIYVNNNRITKFNYLLIPGMNITIDTKNNRKKEFPFEILLEDKHLLIINKPSSLSIFSKDNKKENSLYYIVKEYLKETKNISKFFLIRPLEKEMSGIVIFAKDEKTKKKFQENWQDYIVFQEFIAVVEGNLLKKEEQIIKYLKENKANVPYISKDNTGNKTITNYKVIKENEQYSLLEIKVKDYHKNQIRLVLNSLNHPIVGDNKSNNSRLYLHSNRLKFYYPDIKKEILIETSIPQEFKKIIK